MVNQKLCAQERNWTEGWFSFSCTHLAVILLLCYYRQLHWYCRSTLLVLENLQKRKKWQTVVMDYFFWQFCFRRTISKFVFWSFLKILDNLFANCGSGSNFAICCYGSCKLCKTSFLIGKSETNNSVYTVSAGVYILPKNWFFYKSLFGASSFL